MVNWHPLNPFGTLWKVQVYKSNHRVIESKNSCNFLFLQELWRTETPVLNPEQHSGSHNTSTVWPLVKMIWSTLNLFLYFGGLKKRLLIQVFPRNSVTSGSIFSPRILFGKKKKHKTHPEKKTDKLRPLPNLEVFPQFSNFAPRHKSASTANLMEGDIGK